MMFAMIYNSNSDDESYDHEVEDSDDKVIDDDSEDTDIDANNNDNRVDGDSCC